MYECTKEQFLKDVANHSMEVKLDNGLHKHLVFKANKNSWNQWFEIVTWPGKLTISGDMGTWVFSRIEDMFDFFRTDSGNINPSYWGEKIQNGVSGGTSEAKEYDGDAYKTRVLKDLQNYNLSDEHKAVVIEALNELDFDNEYNIYSELHDFQVDLDDSEPYIPTRELIKQPYADYQKRTYFTFQDLWEIESKVYSYQYIWCCYAIVWAIQMYDKNKENAK